MAALTGSKTEVNLKPAIGTRPVAAAAADRAPG